MTDSPPPLPTSPTRLSVVIPVGPGEQEADGLLAQLPFLPVRAEVILLLADATPRALPADWPQALPVVQVPCEGGRARMMNAGAALATGLWAWFLHADTRLLPGSLDALAAFLARDQRALGWFRLAFRPGGPALTRLNACGANLRAHWLGLPFGDQGLLLRTADFRALGGFDEAAPYGEDHLLVWEARAAGIPARPVGAALATSPRKYARLGWARTTLLHWRLTVEQAWPAWRRLHRRVPRQEARL